MGKLHQDDVRSKIQATQLIKILTQHGVEGIKDFDPSRLKAIEILLRKSLPDLSSVQVSGDPENPLTTVTRIELVAQGGNSTD